MQEINKEEFGTFLAGLRKEQGMTQKELAQKVYVSDKAVSKWERGLSMPDITLLIPLARTLGVTVTELLECRRLEQESLEPEHVEQLVQSVITYTEETPAQRRKRRKSEIILFTISTIAVILEFLGLRALQFDWEQLCLHLLTYELLFIIFSGYFIFFSKDRLPNYYDENKIDAYSDGFLRMNLPGIHFNNRNWMPIKRTAVRSMLISAVALPVLFLICSLLIPDIAGSAFVFIGMPLFFVLFFAPMYAAARKYE